jgi:hypothetical protein
VNTLVVPLALVFAIGAFAGTPTGVITTGSGLTINGKAVQSAGAPNWPVSAGDQISAGKQGAVVTLKDGTRVAVAPMSTIELKPEGYRVVQNAPAAKPEPFHPVKPPCKSKHDDDDDHGHGGHDNDHGHGGHDDDHGHGGHDDDHGGRH